MCYAIVILKLSNSYVSAYHRLYMTTVPPGGIKYNTDHVLFESDASKYVNKWFRSVGLTFLYFSCHWNILNDSCSNSTTGIYLYLKALFKLILVLV